MAVERKVRVGGELAEKIILEQRSQLHNWGKVALAVRTASAKALREEMLGVFLKQSGDGCNRRVHRAETSLVMRPDHKGLSRPLQGI